ncbi:hypothetical protein LG943_21265 [Streptomonospora sp. S1-112]|uniref:Guanylate cyclase domain-containing protein n=1 Tax=Streptomonospora mangrovi TaxID=2883123 RepID=A0A9X3NR19_9ACTN|nr:hypothetical protein [Streptomonospora mangrovi]MDA0566823.1 hypothetical protein [Streptomonospora mangrovi]
MPTHPRPPRTSSPLPPYRAVLAVDIESYTGNSSYHQGFLSTTVESVLEEAFSRSGLEEVWQDRRFPQRAGDGYVVGFPTEHLPFMIHPMLAHLQQVLEDTQPHLAARQRDLRLRLRASIDVGPLPDSTHQGDPLDGIGRAMNDTHRLLDSPPVREELRQSDPDTTLLVAIVSGRVHEEAVRGGYVGLSPHLFRPVDVEMPEKRFRHEGYLHVPLPSRCGGAEARTAPAGDCAPAEDGGAPAAGSRHRPTEGARPRAEAGTTTNRIRDNYGQAVQGGTFSGGLHGDFRGRANG